MELDLIGSDVSNSEPKKELNQKAKLLIQVCLHLDSHSQIQKLNSAFPNGGQDLL